MAPDLFTRENGFEVCAFLIVITARDDRGTGMVETDETQVVVRGKCPRIFLVPNQLMGKTQTEAAILHGPGHAGPAPIELGLLPTLVVLPHGFAVVGATLPRHVVIEPVPSALTELPVFCGKGQIHRKARDISAAVW